MSEKLTPSEQPTPKKKIETKQDPNGFWGKNVYEIRQKVEELNKPEAKEFFDFWWLITDNKNGSRQIDIKTDSFDDFEKDPKTGKLKVIKNKTTLREYAQSSYQTFKGNTLTIMIKFEGDLNIDDDYYPIDTKVVPDWEERYAHTYKDELNASGEPIPESKYDATRNHNDTKIQLNSNGSIMLRTKESISNGVYQNNKWSKPIVINGQRAADFIEQLKKKFLERFVNREDDKGITDNELNDILNKQ